LPINMMFCFSHNRVIVLPRRGTNLALRSTSVVSKPIIEFTFINF
jgi:hypothetical protein